MDRYGLQELLSKAVWEAIRAGLGLAMLLCMMFLCQLSFAADVNMFRRQVPTVPPAPALKAIVVTTEKLTATVKSP